MSLSARTGGASSGRALQKASLLVGEPRAGRTHRCAPTAARRVVLRHCEEGRRPDAAIRIPRTRRILTAPSGPRNDGSAGASPRPTWFTPSVGAGVLTGPQAATWGRPYENSGPLWSVGADLRVRPPVLGAHIGAPLRRRAESSRPTRCIFPQGRGQVAPSSGPAGHLPPRGKVRRAGSLRPTGAHFPTPPPLGEVPPKRTERAFTGTPSVSPYGSTASLPPFVPSGHFPIPSVAARHLPLIRGVGPLTGGIGLSQGGRGGRCAVSRTRRGPPEGASRRRP